MSTLRSMTAISTVCLLVACAPAKELSEQTLASDSAATSAISSASNAVSQSSQSDLTGMLTNQLGVNQQQALGGAGSIFALAQKRMKPGDFMQLSSSVPDMDQYLSAVPDTKKSSNSLFSSAAELMGEGSSLGSLANLAGSFQSLGMDSSMINQFVPVVLKYVQGQGGAGAMSLLQNALY